jgi:hypothetical protein
MAMYPRSLMPLAILCAAGLLAGCGSGGGVASTSSTPAGSSSASAVRSGKQASPSSGKAPSAATPYRRSTGRAQLGKSHQSVTPSSSGKTHVRTHTTLSTNHAQAPQPALPLVKGPKLDVTNKVVACFKAGHAGIIGSSVLGPYEIFSTTGPGGGHIEVAATRSVEVAGEVGKAITATGHYILVPTATPDAVAAIEKGVSSTDRTLAAHCAEVAG